jgi:hypothetical protein
VGVRDEAGFGLWTKVWIVRACEMLEDLGSVKNWDVRDAMRKSEQILGRPAQHGER